MLRSDELIQFLLWAEQIHRPRLFRLCEYWPQPHSEPEAQEYNPILQTLSAIDHKPLGNDLPGQAGIRSLVEQYNNWCTRLAVGKARELTAVIMTDEHAPSTEEHYDELAKRTKANSKDDTNCITLPDGSCVGTNCMHDV